MKYISHMPSTLSAQSTNVYDRRPDTSGKCTRFGKYVYDKESRTCCNRTAKSWMLLCTFFILFTSIVLGIFFLALFIEIKVIHGLYGGSPWFEKQHLTPDAFPGLSFLPNIAKLSAPIIWYTISGLADMKPVDYTDKIDNFLQPYLDAEQKHKDGDTDYVKCSKGEPSDRKHTTCLFFVQELDFCSKYDYGYENKTPCFYLKLNKLENWRPDTYTKDDFPSEGPKQIKEYLDKHPTEENIYVSCDGRTAMDVEHIKDLTFYPSFYFPAYYYPFLGNIHFLTPLVAVHVKGLTPGLVVTIECKTWAPNIKHTPSSTPQIMIYIED